MVIPAYSFNEVIMLNVTALSKKFQSKQVLKDISFSITSGEIVGLIGPNGSGKTTLLNILMGILYPSSGSIKADPHIKVGMAVSRMGFFDDMTAEDNLSMYFDLAGIKNDKERLEWLMNYFLIDYKTVKYGKLSAGMKQKVSLLMAFLDNYDLTYLDEPTNHLDVDSIFLLRSFLAQKRNEGCSFLVSSHILTDLEKICDRILFIKDGIIIAKETTSELIKEYGTVEDAYLRLFRTNNAA